MNGDQEKVKHASNSPSLVLMELYKGQINIENVSAPPKTNLERAMYQRVTNFINPDISVVIDSYEFLCHRLVLQCYSGFFSQAKNVGEIEVKGVTKGAFIATYNWMLSSENEALRHIQKNNILDVLVASKALAIPELENQCLAMIDSKEAFSEESAFFLYIDASRKLQTEIMDLMVPRIQYFFLLLVSSKEFDELEVNDLCAILQSNYIIVHCELEIFMAAVKWLMSKWKIRNKLVGSVMRCVRFGLMTPAQLVDIRKNPMSVEFVKVTSNKTVQLLIEDGLSYSVENNLSGKTEQHEQRCKLLGLKVPEPRNFVVSKNYSSYSEFLKYLDRISNDPQTFYADIKGQNIDEEGSYKKFENLAYSEDSDTEIDKSDRVTSKKPSLSDLLYQSVKDISSRPSKGSRESIRVTSKSDVSRRTLGRRTNESSTEFSSRKSMNSCRECKKRVCLREQAAIVIQATWRGFSVRKDLGLTSTKIPTKPRLFDSLCLGFRYKNKQGSRQSTMSLKNRNDSLCSSAESLESIISVKEVHKVTQRLIIIGGIDPSGNKKQSLQAARQVYSLHDKYWQQMTQIPSPRYYHGSAILNGLIYVVGGCDSEFDDSLTVPLSADNYSFDPIRREWKLEPRLKTLRRSFGLVSWRNHLYAIGGQDENNTILSSVERYDPETKLWEEMSPLPEPLIGSAICVFADTIWVAGGMNGNTANVNVSRAVWSYDPKSDTWVKKPSLRFGRAFASLVSLECSLYMVGGVAYESDGIVSNDHLDVWNEDSATWRLKGRIEVPRHGHTVAFLGSLMVLVGGVTTKNIERLNQIEAFCVKTGTRTKQIASLPHPLIGHSCVLLSKGNDLNLNRINHQM